jgi:two-component sensor histidine kinase/ligand-binding sensor domain-containing protein
LKTFLRLIILACLLCNPFYADAQGKNYIVQKKLYTYSDGIPGNKVSGVVQDELGYIWIATTYGICRFDGRRFEVFTPKTHGLQNKPIGMVYSDGQHGLVIAYQSSFYDNQVTYENLDVLDIRTLQVKPLDVYYRNMPFARDQIHNLYVDQHNRLKGFFVTPYDYFNIQTRVGCPRWIPGANGGLVKKERTVRKCIIFEDNGKTETAKSVDFNAQSDLRSVDVVLMADSELILNFQDQQQFVYRDDSGNVFRRTDTRGKWGYYFISYAGDVRYLGETEAAIGNYTARWQNQYSSQCYGLEEGPQHYLAVFSRETGAIPVTDSTDQEELKRAHPIGMIRDRSGNYWIGTTEGLLKVTLTEQYFHTLYTAETEPVNGNQSVRGILVQPDFSAVALGSHQNIRYKDRVYRISKNINHSSLYFNNTLWLGSFDLETFDFVTGKTTQRQRSVSEEIWSMYPCGSNRILLGCTKNLDMYDCDADTIVHVDAGNFPVPLLVYRIFAAGTNRIICVASNGIYELDSTGRIRDWFGKNAKTVDHQLPFENINDLHIDREGTYWFATAQDGLFRWDRTHNTFSRYGIDEGFLTARLCRIEAAGSDILWISTDFGLARFNKQSGRAKTYTTAEGLHHNEFNRSSSYRDASGNLWFGTIDGCVYFNPEDLAGTAALAPAPFLIRSIARYNPATSMQEDVSEELRERGYLELRGNSRSLSLRVLLLDLQEREHLYMYELKGQDPEKKYAYDGQINLSNLPYGTFTLVITAQQADGTWYAQPLSIELHILPPFYRSAWFIALVIVVLILIVWMYFRYRIRKISREKKRLENTVEERTGELRASLAEQTALLQELHHRVKNNLQFIVAMLQMQINAVKDETNKAVLKDTSLRINAMSLVHEMLYNKDKLEYIAIETYLHELVAKLRELVYADHAPVTIKTDIDPVKFNVNDSVAIGMLTSEIISNSIKYAFAGNPDPVIEVSLKYAPGSETIIYRIADNGCGINENTKGKGLGLRLIDIFSRQLEATYTTSNTNGLTFTFEIPYRRDEKSV